MSILTVVSPVTLHSEKTLIELGSVSFYYQGKNLLIIVRQHDQGASTV